MKHEDLPCKGKFCGRSGLPILPLRVAYVPDGASDLPDGVYAAPEFYYQTMRAGRYQLRVITEGFVYTYDKRRSHGWRVFAATPSGRFRELPLDDGDRPDEPPKFSCTLDGHNLEASLISVEAPDKASEPVWVGYSRAWWTADVRKRLKDDAVARREVMVEVDAKAIHGGGHPDPEAGFKVDTSGAKLVEHVQEYRDYQEGSQKFAVTTTMALDRTSEAASLAERMHDLASSGGIALALRDPVGIVQDISKYRNYKAGELAQYRLQQNNLREYVVADLVMGLKGQLDDAGKSSEWPRYAQHVDMGRVRDVYSEHQRRTKKWEQTIAAAAKDWAHWIQQDSLWHTLDTYDGEDRIVVEQLERDLADCLDGAGAVASEQEVIDDILAENFDDKHQALWLGFAGGNKSLLKFIAGQLAGDKGLGVFKDMRTMADSFKQWLAEQRSAGTLARETSASVVIGRTLGSQLSRLATSKPEQATRLRTRVSFIAAARMDIAIVPYRYTVDPSAFVSEIYQAGWGPAGDAQVPAIRSGATLWYGKSMHGAWLATQIGVEAQITMNLWLPEAVRVDNTQAAAAGVAIGALPGRSLARLPAAMPTPFQGLLKWLKTLDGPIAGLGAVLSVGALTTALQDYFTEGLPGGEEAKRKAGFGIASGISGVLGVTAEVWGGVVKHRIVPGLAKTQAAKLFAYSGVLSVAGGVFAAGAAISEGVYLLAQGYGLERKGDATAGDAYKVSGAFFVVSGLASFAAGMAQASALLTAAGITGASGGVLGALASAASVLAFIPVWGWIVLGIAALLAGLYFLFRGQEEEDTPIEQWLSRSALRNEAKYAGTERSQYQSLEDELAAFNQAIFQLRITLTWLDEPGRDRVILQVILPGFEDSRSQFAYRFAVAGSRREIVIARRDSELSRDPDLRPRPPTQATARAAPERSWLEQQAARVDAYVARQTSQTGWMDAWEWVREASSDDPVAFAGSLVEPAVDFQIRDGYALLSTEVLVDDESLFSEGFDRATLELEYWPDPVRSPSLMVDAGDDGLNYRIERD